MNKQLLSFLLTMLMSMVGTKSFAHDIEVANSDGVTIYYDWTNNNTELSVSCRGKYYDGYTNEYSGNVVIPSSVEYNGKKYNVTSISGSAFRRCSDLISITIPNSVTSIGQYAFEYCSGLTSVTIGNSVTSIRERAFADCSGLTSITIPNSVTSIGSNAFEKCSGLIKVIIGENIKNLYTHAFAYCDKMRDFYCYAYHYPTAGSDVFKGSYIDYVTLHVPQDAIKQYAGALPWKNFKEIVAITDEDTDDREIVGQEFTVDGIYYITEVSHPLMW